VPSPFPHPKSHSPNTKLAVPKPLKLAVFPISVTVRVKNFFGLFNLCGQRNCGSHSVAVNSQDGRPLSISNRSFVRNILSGPSRAFLLNWPLLGAH
jgi:hypothetical protein